MSLKIKNLLEIFFLYYNARLLRIKSLKSPPLVVKPLISCVAGIGDVLLCTPLIEYISITYNVKVDLIVSSNSKQILKDNKFIGKIFIYNQDDSFHFLETLNNENYNYIISARSTLKLLRTFLLYKSKFYFNFNSLYEDSRIFKRILCSISRKYKKSFYSKKHIRDYYLEIAGVKNKTIIRNLIPMMVGDKLPDEINNFIKTNPTFVALHVGGSDPIRKLNTNLINQIIDFGFPIILLGDKDDQNRLSNVLKVNDLVFNAMGVINLNQVYTLLKLSKCCIAPDSIVMHIAASAETNLIALMGNASIDIWGPISNKNNCVILHRKAHCSPCSKVICYEFNGHSCVQDISSIEIKSALLNFITTGYKIY